MQGLQSIETSQEFILCVTPCRMMNDESDFLGTVYADISKNKDKITEKDYLGKLLKYTSCNSMCRRYRYSTQNLVTGTDTH